MTDFRAFRIRNDAVGYRSGIEETTLDDLEPRQLVIKAADSSVNYEDAPAADTLIARSPVLR